MNGLATRTVLIVEDEWLVRMELAAAFEDELCVVLESASAEDAITRLHSSRDLGVRVDLLVTDIRLSGQLTGWDLAAEARSLDSDLAVIYVSANPPAPDRVVSHSVFIDKPALISQVVGAARGLVAG